LNQMNLRDITRRYLGWCPGYESVENFVPDRNTGKKTLAVSFIVLLLSVVLVFPFEPFTYQAYVQFMLMAFMAFIGGPIMWRIVREEKAGDQDGTYPTPPRQPLPRGEFGEFKMDSPAAEAPVFGPSRSSAGYNWEIMMSREWLHPDILWYKRRFIEEKEEKEENK